MAKICNVAPGTIKSRVHQARKELAKLLLIQEAAEIGPDAVTKAALQGSVSVEICSAELYTGPEPVAWA